MLPTEDWLEHIVTGLIFIKEEDMRHFWFTDGDEDIMADHRGTLKGAINRAEDYLKKNPECEAVYINDGEDIVEVVWR